MSAAARALRLRGRLPAGGRGPCAGCNRPHAREAAERILDGERCAPCRCEGCGCAAAPSPLLVASDVAAWSAHAHPGRALRPYQATAARHVVAAALRGAPGPLVLLFARQSGKDETLAQALAYLLRMRRRVGGSVVVANPTWRPQSVLSQERLGDRLAYPGCHARPASRHNVLELGRARAAFLSADPTANARGETADLLLVCNEAQDVEADRWDAVFAPMAASTGARAVFLGTPWTPDTLLARQTRYARELEARDGRRHVFRVDWREVAASVPEYGAHVEERAAQLGERSPWVRTEYCLEELDPGGTLFTPEMAERLRGSHPAEVRPDGTSTYVLALDVGGEDTGREGADARRDSSCLTAARVRRGPTGLEWEIVARSVWRGLDLGLLAEAVAGEADRWGARQLVVDATGLGAGVASSLRRALGERRVSPFVFTQASKSDLGWQFLWAAGSGRLRDHAPDGSASQALFRAQLGACRWEAGGTRGGQLEWGVPSPGHDDALVSAALLCAADEAALIPRVAVGRRNSC